MVPASRHPASCHLTVPDLGIPNGMEYLLITCGVLDGVIQKGVARETALTLPATQAMGAQRRDLGATEAAGMGAQMAVPRHT